MPVSVASQISAVKLIAALRPDQLLRTGLSLRAPQAEMLSTQLADAVKTLEIISRDANLRRTIESST